MGNQVWLSRWHFHSQRPSRKLDAQFIGPFCITDWINLVAYGLQLPPTLQIYPVFHQSLLVPAAPPDPFRSTSPPPPPMLVERHLQYEVAQILDSRCWWGHLLYIMDWNEYGPEEGTYKQPPRARFGTTVPPGLTPGPGSGEGPGGGDWCHRPA